MAESDQAVRDIVAQLVSNGQAPDAAAAPASMGVMPAPEVTPTMLAPVDTSGAAPAPAAAPASWAGPHSVGGAPIGQSPQAAAPSTVPGPGGYSAADRFNKFSLPAGGGPLSVADAQKVIDSYESTGGHAFAPADPSAPSSRTIQVGDYAMPLIGAPPRASAGSDWTMPTPVMTPPPVTPLGAMAAVPRPRAPVMGSVLARR